MSDVFEGPGWWMASNGKWYPPENHPDERYRARFAMPAPVVDDAQTPLEPPPVPEQVHRQPEEEIPEQSVSEHTETTTLLDLQQQSPASYSGPPEQSTEPDFPSVELRSEPDTAATPTSFTELARPTNQVLDQAAVAETAELSGTDLANEMARVAEQRAAEQERAKAAVYQAVAHRPDDAEPADAEPAAAEPADDDLAVENTSATETPIAAPATSEPEGLGEAPDHRIFDAERPAPEETPDARRFSVASPEFTNPTEQRPSFDDNLPPSVVAAPQRTGIGLTQIELDQPPVDDTTPVTSGRLRQATPVVTPTAAQSTSTALVHVPTPALGVATTRDRIVSALLFLSGVSMMIGSFLDWTSGDLVQTGWERGDGILTVVAGIIGASMAGPIFVGFRHAIPKAAAIIAGVVAGIALGLVAVNSVLNAPGIDFALGFIIVAVAAAVMIIAGAADEGEFLDY